MLSKITNKYLKYAIIAAIIVAAVFITPYVLGIFSPFIVAAIIAIPSQKLVKFLQRRLKIPRTISSALIVLAIVTLIGGLIVYLVYQLALEARGLVYNLPYIITDLRAQLDGISERFDDFVLTLPPEVGAFLDNILLDIQQGLTGTLTPDAGDAIPAVWSVAGNVTTTLFYIIIVIMSAFFLIKDYDKIIAYFRGKMSEASVEKWLRIRKSLSVGFLSFIKAQLIISFVTFVIVSIALLILDVNHAIAAAFFIGIADFVPVFGPGLILIPWMIIAAISGEWVLLIGLLALQIICFIVRNILQPKILSSQVGIHPLLTLMSIFIGFYLFSVWGLLFGPIVALLGASLYHSFKAENMETAESVESEN